MDSGSPTCVTDTDYEKNPGFLLLTTFEKIRKGYNLTRARTYWTSTTNQDVFLIFGLF
jgi:hypothetical protein